MSSRVARILMPVLFAAACAAPAFGAAPPEAQGKVGIASVWKLHKIDFHYFGRTSRYSCDGMSDKVRSLLMQMGARHDLKLLTYGCEIGRVRLDGINPGLTIEFWAPVPVAAADKSSAGADAKAIDARYEPFTFHQDVFQNLDVGDCEMVEEFVHQVLPKFAVRALKQSITCVPYQHQAGSYFVSGEVLKAVNRPAADASRDGGAR
jgi:hypothetical protein